VNKNSLQFCRLGWTLTEAVEVPKDLQKLSLGCRTIDKTLIPSASRGLENPTSRKGESQWKINLERILKRTFTRDQNPFHVENSKLRY
jgi:hypothetical protein